MLTELTFDYDGKTRIDLVDGTTMSIITPQRRREVDATFEVLAQLFGGREDPHPIPDHLVEVCFVHPEEPRPLPEVLVPEWVDHIKDAEFAGSWTIYHVSAEQVLDYANKVGVK